MHSSQLITTNWSGPCKTHATSTGILNRAYTKWTKNSRPDRSCTEVKKYFRKALANVKAINKITTGETNFGANAVEER